MNINYENEIRIDETALDVEWLEQPRLFMKYARNAAQARKRVDEAKEALDVAKAELDKKIRSNPKKYGVEKITENAISNLIIKQDTYKEAMQEFSDARYEADIAQSAVSAFNQRKEALENLVKLFGMQYFSGPRVPRDLSQEYKKKETQKQADNIVATNFKRRK
jgi:glycine betaine/choline ABC-type transport system substrate-binding protein